MTNHTEATTGGLSHSTQHQMEPAAQPGLAAVEVALDHGDEMEAIDHDSAIEIGSYRSSTWSVTSSIVEGHEENGRTYHSYKEGIYPFPNDTAELNRLDLQHKMWEIELDGNLHLAPIGQHPQEVLDMATGSGIWAIDFATAYPSAIVTGTDLSAVRPAYVPQNCEFQIDDMEDEWVVSRPFDYIHGRACVAAFKDPKVVFQQAFDNLKPGGYLEMQDLNIQTAEGDTRVGTALDHIQTEIEKALAAAGMSWDTVVKYKQWMEEVGFVDVVEVKSRWPTNPHWPKDPKEKVLGAWFSAQIGAGLLESVCTRIFLVKLGWTKAALDELLAKAKENWKSKSIRAYNPVYIVYGRKPAGGPKAETETETAMATTTT